MSKLIVEVCQIDKVEDHPNGDFMKIATIKGWKTCIKHDPETGKSDFSVGDLCVYFPPDAILPPELANKQDDPETPGRLGVINYLGMLPKDENGKRPAGGRVRAARLRGVPSYGVVMPIDVSLGDDPNWKVGDDVAEHFGITKYEPPMKAMDGDAETPHSLFHPYTSIENYQNYPNIIVIGEEVVFTEKIHGTNCRIGLAKDSDEFGQRVWTWMGGSHKIRRKEFDKKEIRSQYWMPLDDSTKELINHLKDEFDWPEEKQSIIVFCEIFGSGVQDMNYGMENGARKYCVFDIAINEQYLDYDVKARLLHDFGIPMVNVIYRGPYTHEAVEEYTSGDTTMCDPKQAGKFDGREGIVITPTKERYDDLLGRVILKSVSADYLGRRGKTTDYH